MPRNKIDQARRPQPLTHLSRWGACLFLASQAIAQQPTTPETAEALHKPRPRLPMTQQLRVYRSEPIAPSTAPLWCMDQNPAQFLDAVGSRLKARWRQLYREPPPPPCTDRQRAAFTLGGLLADCYLTVQATDAQQFKNNSQDVLAYSRLLAIGDKVTPRIMSASKLAETEKWPELRQDLINGHQELCGHMREHKDDDLALLVELGLWMRMLEMVSTLVIQAKDAQFWPHTVGSADLVKSLNTHFFQLSEPIRSAEKMLKLGEVIDYLQRHWAQPTQPTEEAEVIKTHERISLLMRSMTLK
jgi:hypothetical protein